MSSVRPIVYGASYSTYVRTVRLALEEKGISYDLVEVDVFSPGGLPAEYLKINPFGRIPSFEHQDFRLYEAVPIARYVDESFAGPKLQPHDTRERARMNQILAILDCYAYRAMVWDIYVERSHGERGKQPDERRIAAALPLARKCLNELSRFMGDQNWLAGPALTLADLHAAPIFDYFVRTAEGRDLLASTSTLIRWWKEMAKRPSMSATKPKAEPLP